MDSEGGFDSLQTAATHTCNFNGVAQLKKKVFFPCSRILCFRVKKAAPDFDPYGCSEFSTCADDLLPALQSRVRNTRQYPARSPSS